MEWLNTILKDVEGNAELVKAIQTELPKHFKPANVFNEVNEKLKDANAKIAETATAMKELQTLKDKDSEWEAKYEAMETKHNKFADEVEAKDIMTKKISVMTAKLKDANAIEENIPLLLNGVDFDKLSVDGENVIGSDDAVNNMKTTYSKSFTITSIEGTPPGQGQTTNPTNKQTLISQYEAYETLGDVAGMRAIDTQIKALE